MWSPVVSPPDVPEDKVPVSRCKHATVLHGQCLYLLGGRNGNLPMKDFWKYCIADNKWYQLETKGASDFPGCLQDHTMIGYRDTLYIFGGEVGFSNGVETPLWTYNITKNEWKKFQAPKGVVTPKGRRSHTATVFQDSLYIYGGYQDLKGSTSELWAFHFASQTWHLVSQGGLVDPNGPPPRHRHSAVLHNNALWVFGGMTDLQERSDFWRFDFVSRRWRPVKSKPGPGCLHSHCAVKFLSVMMLFGGEREGQTLNEMWRFHFATEFWERLTFASTNTPMPRAQTTAFIFSQFTTRGAVHYMGLPEQDYFGSQPQPSGKKVKLNHPEGNSGNKSTPQSNTSSNIQAILPSSMKMSKYEIMGKQRCPTEEDIYEEIDDFKVEFRDPKLADKSNNKKSTYSFEPPENCTVDDEEYENTSNIDFNAKDDESTNGKCKKFMHKRHENSNDNEIYSGYEQIPKELLRDLTRSGNFRQLNEESKKQSTNGASSQGSGKLLNGVQTKMSQLNLTRLSSISGNYSMFSNESTESINTMGSVGTPTTIDSNSTVNATCTFSSSRNGNGNGDSIQNIRKSASSSFSMSSSSGGNTIGSPPAKSNEDEAGKNGKEGTMVRDLRSVPNLASCLAPPDYEAIPSDGQPTNCDSIELLNFADANEVQAQTSSDDADASPTDDKPSMSITTTAIIENKANLQEPTTQQDDSTKQQPTRSDSAYTFQSYDYSSRSSTLSSTAANNAVKGPANKTLSRPLKAINSKSVKSKASCTSTSGLLSKNGSQVKLIDLEDEDDEIEYPATYFNSTEDDLNDFSSLSGYESMEGGTHYESSILPVPPITNAVKPTIFSYKNLTSGYDSRKTIGCESKMSFANPHYLCPDAQTIYEKRGGTNACQKKMSQVSSVFGERMLGLVRDDLSHENFAQALNSPAESLISDYNDFQARLNHDLVELKTKNNEILSAESSAKIVKSNIPNSIDAASNHYYQTVEEEHQNGSNFVAPNHVELVQLRTKPSKTIHTPSMTPQLGRKIGQHTTAPRSTRPLSTGSILSGNSSFTTSSSSTSNTGKGTLRRCLPQQPIEEEKTSQFYKNGSNLEGKKFGNGQPPNRNQLKLLMFIVGGREIGQVTLFKRPISMWKLDLTRTF